jgi:hypothetical protein
VTPTEQLETLPRGDTTVLVAEDDVICGGGQLREEEYSVVEASNAEEVLSVLRTGARVKRVSLCKASERCRGQLSYP